MNVLILTPDRVGSTLLQRLITIYMLRKGFDKPVINLHELTNGLEKYYSPIINDEVLGKPKGTNWGYYQSLSEIIAILKSTDHYKTSRLAHYHITKRGDSLNEQIKFYEYLNDNFFIISCRRENILEYALSWCINAFSKKLNVYSSIEKVNVFSEIYNNGITVDPYTLTKYLNAYKKYIDWCDKFFNVQSVFVYEKYVNDIENYILSLDFMSNSSSNSWHDMFGQSFNNFNQCHKLLSDLVLQKNYSGNLKYELSEPLHELHWDQYKGSDWPEFEDMSNQKLNDIDTHVKQEILQLAKDKQLDWSKTTIYTNHDVVTFLTENLQLYKKTFKKLDSLVRDGFLVTSVPIKLQTLQEKKQIIKNFSDVVKFYNKWVEENDFGLLYNEEELNKLMLSELSNINLLQHDIN